MHKKMKSVVIVLILAAMLSSHIEMIHAAKLIEDTTTQKEVAEIAASLSVNKRKIEFVENDENAFQLNMAKFPYVPLYDQTDYQEPYGDYGTIASHGCGPTCISMVGSYLLDKELTPVTVAKDFGSYNTDSGSYWTLFPDSAKEYGIPYEGIVYSIDEAVKALKDGKMVISIQSGGIFTTGGHFILLTGITENDKIIVNDPYGPNYEKKELLDGYSNGFAQEQISENSIAYWIYGKKN